MRVLVVDNYDSFAYNLVQYVGEVVTGGAVRTDDDPRAGELRAGGHAGDEGEVVVRRNDAVDLAAVDALDPDAVVVSPGPGTPADAGVSVALFEARSYPTLGVCLGHQALCAAYGADVGHAPAVVHGKPSEITHDGAGIFQGIPSPIEVGRYHSLAVDAAELPDVLVETAHTVAAESEGLDAGADRVVMGVRHREKPHVGVQFHPESILTDAGLALVANFLDLVAERGGSTPEESVAR